MLVSLSNLKTYMDVSFTARQEDAAVMVLAGLQGELEAFLKRPIEPQSFVEKHRLDPTHGGVPMGTFLSLNSNDSYNSTFYDTGSSNSQMNWASTCPTIFLKNTPDDLDGALRRVRQSLKASKTTPDPYATNFFFKKKY